MNAIIIVVDACNTALDIPLVRTVQNGHSASERVRQSQPGEYQAAQSRLMWTDNPNVKEYDLF